MFYYSKEGLLFGVPAEDFLDILTNLIHIFFKGYVIFIHIDTSLKRYQPDCSAHFVFTTLQIYHLQQFLFCLQLGAQKSPVLKFDLSDLVIDLIGTQVFFRRHQF